MKTIANSFVLFASLVAVSAAFAAADTWTYDSSAGTISDGEWTFNATVSGANLTVNAVTNYPQTCSTLNFAKPVNGNYTIVTLNPHFPKYTNTHDLGYRPGDLAETEACTRVGELILPKTGLTSISAGAFAHCSNLTNIVNYLPDSVTSIGNSAFAYCHVEQDLFLRGLRGKANRGIFYSSKIKSVTFGPRFTGISETSNSMRPFESCSHITNIVFSPESSGITFVNNAFKCALAQPLVLYGVQSLNNSAFSGCSVSSITFDRGIENIGTLSGVTGITEIRFLGEPPTSWPTRADLAAQPPESYTFADYGEARSSDVITTYVRWKYKAAWYPYAANGDINLRTSTFSAQCATNPLKRKLLFDEMPVFYIYLK